MTLPEPGKPSKVPYNFYQPELWTGRLASFTKSIDSNLKLLRVILLTKGSSIMEFGLLLEKGEDLLDEENSEFIQAVQAKKKAVRQQVDEIREQINGLTSQAKTVANFSSLLSQKGKKADSNSKLDPFVKLLEPPPSTQQTLDAHYGHSQVQFDFEETQLYNLRTLSIKQKQFVANQLEKSVKHALKPEKGNPARDQVALIRKSYQFIAGDIEIVQRAIVQRVHEVNDHGRYQPSMQASALQITDMLALTALDPFQHLLPNQSDITPITFFSQETHIRSLPCCDDVVLIGIRYDQVLQDLDSAETPPPFELLAIPHEVGHYVYQRAIVKDPAFVNKVVGEAFGQADWALSDSTKTPLHFEEISAQLPLAHKQYRAWCEEIFSDICGCIVAGPMVALGLLSMLVARTDKANRNDQGEHPTGNLRPTILKEILLQLNVLRPTQYPFETVAQDVVATWQDAAQKSASPELDEDIRRIIRVFARILLANAPKDFHPWISATVEDLSACAAELKQINTLSGLTNLEPRKLDDAKPEGGDDIQALVEEWQEKGPITIGDHD